MIAPQLTDVERNLALGYVSASRRVAVAALWQLDEKLGRIVASTTEPMIGQIRLTWWHERLRALDSGEQAAEPILRKMAEDVLPYDVNGADLAGLIEGWEALLEALPLNEASLITYAEKRGEALFQMSGRLLATDVSERAGQGWALADFATHCSDAVTAERALWMAKERLGKVSNLPKPLRILARLARAKAYRPVERIGHPLPRFVFLRAVLG
jgi:phytoene synthase